MQKIKSPNNSVIKMTNSLFKKKYRDKYNKFIVLGIKSLYEFIKNFKLDYILLSAENKQIEREFKNVYYVDKSLFLNLSNVYKTNFLIAIFHKHKNFNTYSSLNKNKSIVFLDDIQDPGNTGNILRTVHAFNIDQVVITNDSVDLFNIKLLSSIKNSDVFKKLFLISENNVISLLKDKKYIKIFCNRSNKKSFEIKNLTSFEKIILVFGNEGHGVSQKYLKYEDYSFWIKMENDFDSLNVSSAFSIIIYLFKNKFNNL